LSINSHGKIHLEAVSRQLSQEIQALRLDRNGLLNCYHPKLNVKGPDITGKPEQQLFTNWSRQRCAISGRPFTEQVYFGPAVCSSTDPPQPAALWPL